MFLIANLMHIPFNKTELAKGTRSLSRSCQSTGLRSCGDPIRMCSSTSLFVWRLESFTHVSHHRPQARTVAKHSRSCLADSGCMGTPDDLPRWSQSVHRIPVLRGRVSPVFALTRPSGTQVTVAHRMKAILFTLVRTFAFELAVPVSEIGSKWTMVQRPVLRSDPNRPQLPLLIKPYKQS